VGVQEVRWEEGGTELAREYTFSYGKENANHELGAGLFVHNRITSVVKRVETDSDRMSYLTIRGLLFHSISLNFVPEEKTKFLMWKTISKNNSEVRSIISLNILGKYCLDISVPKEVKENIFKATNRE
jgi:hypothetical protein